MQLMEVQKDLWNYFVSYNHIKGIKAAEAGGSLVEAERWAVVETHVRITEQSPGTTLNGF